MPTTFIFGNAIGGTAQVKAGSFIKGGANVPAVFIQSSTPTAKQTGDIWFVT